MSETYVQTRSLSKRYGGLTALDDCGLAIRRGEVFGLLGPNGSGKTTLLRLLMGFLRPTSGEATIDGLDCYRDSVAIHRRTAYLPGDARLFPQMRGHAVLRFFSRVRPDAELSRSLALAQRLKLDLTRRVAALSTGMRQKLALAAVLAFDSPLLVLDEPTSNLDPTVRGDVLDLVREARAAGRTVIFSSHVLDEVEQVCDRVGILRHGRLVWVQLMSELRRQHRIRARLTAPLSAIAPAMAGPLDISVDAGRLTILTPGELSPLLGWLATLPLAEVQIEPVGLRAVYDRYHLASAEESA
ncbi:MAG TPA: ABC transporter ATP-binding protein [Pirellulales bacterium]|jgi:ABC-2 type transport system ATP-binding protein|nr:ABC transporter ATP-binding protein [Pirellulales bacterium]